jgi:CRP/FNR family cyclic AMP-dependent transcriptional regulator
MKAKAARAASAIAILAKSGTLVNVTARETIFHQGERVRSIYFIRKGIVMLTAKTKHRRRAVISLVPAGSFLNEGCLLGHGASLSTATTVSPCSIIEIKQREMARMLREESVVSKFFWSALLAHIIRLAEDLHDLLVSNCEERLASTLTRLAQMSPGFSRTGDVPWLDQQTLADAVGTTRNRVSFFMNRFRRRGFISYKRDMRIKKPLDRAVSHS